MTEISRLEFLKLVGIFGTTYMLAPLIPFGRILRTNASASSRPVIIKRVNNVGPDGVAFLYPTRKNGFVWYMNNDKPFDSYFEIGGSSSLGKLIKNADGSWTADDNKSVKFNLNADPNYEDAIGGCDMSFKDSMARGYTHDINDLDNVELTGFFNIREPTGHDGIYLRGPCNHHDQANHLCCEEFSYDCETDCNSTKTRSSVKFTKQSPNESYTDPSGLKTIIPDVTLAGYGWFGIKYIHLILSRDLTNPRVRLEQWLNFNGDGKTWVKINEVVDSRSYKWGPKAICEGQDHEVGAWGAPEWCINGTEERLISKCFLVDKLNLLLSLTNKLNGVHLIIELSI